MGEAHADRAARPAELAVRRGGGDDRACGWRCGRRSRARPRGSAATSSRPAATASTGSPHRGGAAAVRQRLRVRRQDRRRRGATAVHPVGGKGRPRADGAGVTAGYPMVGRPGHPVRRQGALGRLLRHGLPEGGPGCALQDAADKASRCCCWSRWTSCPCWCDDDYVGAVMSDLSSRRGRVLGTEPVGGGRTLVKAEVPELEITGTRSTCGPCPTGRARSPGPTCVTSRCPPTRPRRS